MQFTVVGTPEAGYVDVGLPVAVVAASIHTLGSRQQVEGELDDMLVLVKQFWTLEPDAVMRKVAAYSARLTELWVHLHRIEGRDRTFKQIRTMQVAPLLEEMDRQFRMASRLLEVRRQDMELLK